MFSLRLTGWSRSLAGSNSDPAALLNVSKFIAVTSPGREHAKFKVNRTQTLAF
jgi:hypothetical protein